MCCPRLYFISKQTLAPSLALWHWWDLASLLNYGITPLHLLLVVLFIWQTPLRFPLPAITHPFPSKKSSLLLGIPLLLLLSGRCNWLAHVNASICVLLLLFCWFQNLKRAQERFVDTHHCTCIVKFPTVIWCRKQCNQLSFCKEFVSIFNDLMRSANQVHIVLLQESGHDIGTKGKGYSSIILWPSRDVLVWIWPKKIAKKTWPVTRFK